MKQFLVTLSLLITMFSINFDSQAAMITAISNGSWGSPFTWNFGIPQCGDTVIIPTGTSVTVTVNVNLDTGDPLCDLFRMTIGGDLRFAAGKKMNLSSGACISVEAGGQVGASAKGGGASESIYIGADRVWQASGGTLNGVASLGCAILLPVNIVSFEALKNGESISFTWEVNSEYNVKSYDIEYSEGNLSWLPFAKVPSNSNSSIRKTYFLESEGINKSVYFRLSNIDQNGKKTILTTIRYEVVYSLQNNAITLIPNPIENSELLTVKYETQNEMETTINILDQRGVIIYSTSKIETSTNGEVIFDTSVLKSGTYFVNLSNKNQSLKSKLAVL